MALKGRSCHQREHSSYDRRAPRQVGRQVGGHGVEQERALVLEEAVTFTSISMHGSPFGTADLGGPHDIVRTPGVASGDNPLWAAPSLLASTAHPRISTPAAIKVRQGPWDRSSVPPA